MPLGVVDHLINNRPRPKAEGDRSSHGDSLSHDPQHLRADSFDYRQERYAVVEKYEQCGF